MSPLSQLPRHNPRMAAEPQQNGAPATPKTASRAAASKAGGDKKLSLATLAVIGGLSVGAVTGLALLTDGSEPTAPSKPVAAQTAAKTSPQPSEREPALVTTADVKAKQREVPAVSASPSAVAAFAEEPSKTGSISAPVRLAAPSAPVLPAPQPEPEPPAAAAPPPAAAPQPAAQTRPIISPAEANGYLSKAEAALRIGDLVVARSFFGRVAEGGDARGALGMARTYDAGELKKLPVFGLKGDRAEMERWQARARDLTSTAAYARR